MLAMHRKRPDPFSLGTEHALRRHCLDGNSRIICGANRPYKKGASLTQDAKDAMKLSAQNIFSGKVTEVSLGPVNSRIKVDIGAGNIVTSVVTAGAAEGLELAVGDEVSVVIKSSDVMLAK